VPLAGVDRTLRIAPNNWRIEMSRVMADCRRFESESNCTLTIIGEEDEVLNAAAEHAASVHGHEDTPELRAQIRELFEPEAAYAPGERQAEAFPG
jgi:Protein of unknown function (DUF1059)